MCVSDYLKYKTVTNINIVRKDEMIFPAVHICYRRDARISITRITFEKNRIDYKDLAYEINYGYLKCV